MEEIDEGAFNTEFCYHLDNSRSREIAPIGVEDLRNTLALRPNEPRSGVSLAEHEQSLDARENRAVMDRAVSPVNFATAAALFSSHQQKRRQIP